jgi:predicted dehydrogenase
VNRVVVNRRVAVVGCGSIGARHLRNLAVLGCDDLVAIDPDVERRTTAAAAVGARTAPTLEAALADGASVVLVTSPTHLHLAHARLAVDAGADLFVEKPLAASLDGLDELIAAADAHGTTALVACNLRFHPGLQRAHELVAAGAIGRIVSARFEFGSWLPDWRPAQDYRAGYAARRDSGGGVVLDAIHELDYARWLLGDVESVACFAGKLSSLELETEDVAAILLRFASGAIGEVHLDYVQRAYRRACRLVGEEGTLTWDFGTGETRVYEPERGDWWSFAAPDGWSVNDMYVAELAHFLACLDCEVAPAQSLRDGRRALEIALAALASSEHDTFVRLETAVAA